MPDGTLKITKYVIFMLNQIESSVRFPGRQVSSSTNHLKTSLGLEGSEREGHATLRFPGLGCGDKASIVSLVREHPAYHLQRDRGGAEVQGQLPLHEGGLGLVKRKSCLNVTVEIWQWLGALLSIEQAAGGRHSHGGSFLGIPCAEQGSWTAGEMRKASRE